MKRANRRRLVTAALLMISSLLAGSGASIAADPAPLADPEFKFWFGQDGSGPGQLGEVGEVATGAGRIAVVDPGNDVVHIYEESGVFIRDLGGAGSGPGQFQAPFGVAIAPSGRVYVADAQLDRVSVYGSGGVHKFDFGSTGSGPGLFNSPTDVIVDGSGLIYVADSLNDRIQVFDKHGDYVKSVGPAIKGGDDLLTPVAIDFTTDGLLAIRHGIVQEKVYVVDVTTTPGSLAFEISTDVDLGELTVDEHDRFWLPTSQGPMIVRDRNNKLLGTWDHPASVAPAFDSKGRAVIPRDDNGWRIEVHRFFQCNGRLATYVGTTGDDFATGTAMNDVAVMRGGDDLFIGGPGRDYLCGGGGADELRGGPGKDWIHGGSGADEVFGNGGADKLFGRRGGDVIKGGNGDDEIRGGAKADTLRGNDGDDAIYGGGGADECYGGAGSDQATSCATMNGFP